MNAALKRFSTKFWFRNVQTVLKRHTSSIALHEDDCKPAAPPPSFVEVRIPLKWGMLAGKWWGPQDKRPILVLHGLQDNCGSFDPLIKLLSQDVGFLAIDMVGHGLSDHLPEGMMYESMLAMILIHTIKEYLGWDKISIMGHSLGGIMSFTYGSLFPETVDFCICLDGMYPTVSSNKEKSDIFFKFIESFIHYDRLESTKKEIYTLQNVHEKMFKTYHGSVDYNKIPYILNRNIRAVPSQPGYYTIGLDRRLKSLFDLSATLTVDQNFIGCKRITFPILLIKSNRSFLFHDKNMLEVVRRKISDNGSIEVHSLPGTHHIHLNNAEVVAPLINRFLLKNAVGERLGSIKKEIVLHCDGP